MGRSHHMKRLAMPRSWALPRKQVTWVTRPRPGAHRLGRCMAAAVVLRDVLGVVHSSREARHVLASGQVRVDGRVVRDPRSGVGLMDVLTVGDTNYRCIVDERGTLRYRAIDAGQAGWKVCRVAGKTTIKGGRTQLGLHDGRNILVDDATQYNTGDSLRISVPDQRILAHLPVDVGASAYIIGGRHSGEVARITERIVKRSSMPNEVVFEDFSTIADHVFVLSTSTPLPGVEVSA